MGDLKQGGKKSPGHNKSEYLTRKKKIPNTHGIITRFTHSLRNKKSTKHNFSCG